MFLCLTSGCRRACDLTFMSVNVKADSWSTPTNCCGFFSLPPREHGFSAKVSRNAESTNRGRSDKHGRR